MDEKFHRKASTGTYRVRGVSRDLHRAARLRAASQGTTRRWMGLQALQAHSTGTWTPPDKPSGPRTNGSEHDEWTSADSSHGGRGWES